MAYLQSFVQALAETYEVMRAAFGRNGGILVQNLYKIRTSLRTLRPLNELARRKRMR